MSARDAITNRFSPADNIIKREELKETSVAVDKEANLLPVMFMICAGGS